MSDLSIFFKPLSTEVCEILETSKPESIGSLVNAFTTSDNFPELTDVHLALVGVNDGRQTFGNENCSTAPDFIRAQFYKLNRGNYNLKLIDLGNIGECEKIEDTLFALAQVTETLLKKQIIPIVIGGGNQHALAMYKGYQNLEQIVNLVNVDSKCDIGNEGEELNNQSHFSHAVLHQPSILFNYSFLGYQSYYSNPVEQDLITKLYFDSYRLGTIQKNIELAEPIIRNADLVTVDISSVRQSDAPGNYHSSPHGFYGEELCQICRFAGFSDKLSAFGLFEVNPEYDIRNQTTQLAAQAIWYFIDGFYNRKGDFPSSTDGQYIKYRVVIEDNNHEIQFFKSKKSDRWWMSVPYPPDKKIKFDRHHLVPCSYNDYVLACNNEIPDKWWQTFQKLF